MNQVIALVGMCGSGKSVCCEVFQKRGWEYVYFGGVTMKELEKRGLERNEVNERSVREELRETYGPAAFAILLQDEIKEKLKKSNVCLDGLYSWSELKVLREALGDSLTVVAIITERKKRYDRISKRVIGPLTHEQAQSRDIAEIEIIDGYYSIQDTFIDLMGNEECIKIMKGWLVVNGFLQSNKFEELYSYLTAASKSAQIQLLIKTSTELFSALGDDFFEQEKPDFAIFWDKDYVLAKRLEQAGVPLFNSAEAMRLCDDKTLTAVALQGKVKMPKTMIAPKTFEGVGYTDRAFLSNAASILGFPMVVKEACGSFGKQVYLAKDMEELDKWALTKLGDLVRTCRKAYENPPKHDYFTPYRPSIRIRSGSAVSNFTPYQWAGAAQVFLMALHTKSAAIFTDSIE